MTTLAWCLRNQGRLDEAEELYRRAIECLEGAGPDRTRVGFPLAGLAIVEKKRRNFYAAETLLKRARDASDRDGRTPLTAAASEHLIDLYLEAGRHDQALAESNRFFERMNFGQFIAANDDPPAAVAELGILGGPRPASLDGLR